MIACIDSVDPVTEGNASRSISSSTPTSNDRSSTSLILGIRSNKQSAYGIPPLGDTNKQKNCGKNLVDQLAAFSEMGL